MHVRVKVHSDIAVRIVHAPEQPDLVGAFVYYPNSTRIDIPLMFTITRDDVVSRDPKFLDKGKVVAVTKFAAQRTVLRRQA